MSAADRVLDLAQRLQDLPPAVALAESAYAFPLIEGLHLIGLSVSVGLIVLIDLRLLGLFLREVPVPTVLQQLRPLMLGGFAAVFVSGALLFAAQAATLLVNPAFLAKLAFIALAGLNALVFEAVIARRVAWAEAPAPLPAAARWAGGASLALWSLVIVCGRLIPYLSPT